ncbi:glucose transporter rco-3 protein [Rutstroemia sp. NJR-2017a WRK4]|nr:glucose transporter rco-3 protein [Rutstroemia sp. NJR-2017a WRK4]
MFSRFRTKHAFSLRSIGIKKPKGEAGSSAIAIIVGLFVAFGGVLFGYDTGTIGGIITMRYWLDTFSTGYIDPKTGLPGITSSESSLIVSILSAGTFFGALFAAPLADFIGRRLALMVSLVVFSFGVALQTASTAIPLFTAGRFFAGLGVGLVSMLVGAYQLAITIGLLLAAVVDNATKGRNDSGSYRIPIAIQFAWALILGTGLIFLPETPRYLIKRGRHDKAAKSLGRLRRLDIDDPHLVEELAEIEANFKHEQSLAHGASYRQFFKWHTLGKRLLTGCLLQALQQLTGINFIFYYGTSFFAASGIKQPFVTSMITSSVNVASTFPGLYLVEAWGRRRLLLFGAIGMFICQMIVGSVGTAFPDGSNQPAQKALVAFVCIYIFFFACSWGPVGWVIPGEIFPLGVRAKGISMTTASNWALNWAIAYSTPYLVNPGPGNANLQAKIFFIWGGCCLICAGFVWGLVYETKGWSLEEVDRMYEECRRAWRSEKWVPGEGVGGNGIEGVEGGKEEKVREVEHREGA